MRSPTSVQHANSRIPAKARERLSGRKRGDKTRGHPAREVTSQNVPGRASGSETNANTSTERMGEGKDMVPECPCENPVWTGIGIKSSLLCLRSTHHIPNQTHYVSASGVPLLSGAGHVWVRNGPFSPHALRPPLKIPPSPLVSDLVFRPKEDELKWTFVHPRFDALTSDSAAGGHYMVAKSVTHSLERISHRLVAGIRRQPRNSSVVRLAEHLQAHKSSLLPSTVRY
jgi:hypothetical protein